MSSIQTEQKLLLVHSLRLESQQNKARLQGHEQILYGKPPVIATELHSLEEMKEQPDLLHKTPHLTSFRIRLLIAIILLGVYIFCNYSQLSFAGVNAQTISTYLSDNWFPFTLIPAKIFAL